MPNTMNGEEGNIFTAETLSKLQQALAERQTYASIVEALQDIRWYAENDNITGVVVVVMEEIEGPMGYYPKVALFRSSTIAEHPELIVGKQHLRDCPICTCWPPYNAHRRIQWPTG